MKNELNKTPNMKKDSSHKYAAVVALIGIIAVLLSVFVEHGEKWAWVGGTIFFDSQTVAIYVQTAILVVTIYFGFRLKSNEHKNNIRLAQHNREISSIERFEAIEAELALKLNMWKRIHTMDYQTDIRPTEHNYLGMPESGIAEVHHKYQAPNNIHDFFKLLKIKTRKFERLKDDCDTTHFFEISWEDDIRWIQQNFFELDEHLRRIEDDLWGIASTFDKNEDSDILVSDALVLSFISEGGMQNTQQAIEELRYQAAKMREKMT